MQSTLKSDVSFSGTALHSGRPCKITVRPAAAETGIVFHRTDIADQDPYIFANWQFVEQTPLCTRLVNPDGISVSTIEHLMAGFAGCGIHNAIVDVDGPEVPILDGSAIEYVRAFLTVGTVQQAAPVRAVRVLKKIEVRSGDAVARLCPNPTLAIDFEIEFADRAIGLQKKRLNMSNGTFVNELATSRTFCRNDDVTAMRANGLALGGSLDNALVFDGDALLSPGGLRHDDEPVRHKMLDALGDLSLAGGPILGLYEGVKSGHAMTNSLLRALFADPSAFEIIECDEETSAKLPGAHVSAADVAPNFA